MTGSDSLDRLSDEYVVSELSRQSQMLDEELKNPAFKAKHLGKVIIYHNHEVLAVGNNPIGLCSEIPEDKRNVWAIMRWILDYGK